MDETVIELDDATIAAIEQAAAALGITPNYERQDGEFTVTEFAEQNNISQRTAERALIKGEKEGHLSMRRANVNGHYTKLYSVIDG